LYAGSLLAIQTQIAPKFWLAMTLLP